MGQFVINGARPLSGEIEVSGSKNAALPIIFSTMLTEGVTRLSNIPDIGDVDVAFDILRFFGAHISRNADKAYIDTSSLVYKTPPDELICKIRASSYLLGAALGRFGISEIGRFGGCNFDNRPIDMHIYAALRLGASLDGNRLTAKRLSGADIYFNRISVGATVNAIIMAVSAEGISRIFGFAREPHVISLIDFFRSSGVKIEISDSCITVCGRRPSQTEFRIIPDMIEAGTYILLSLLLDAKIKVKGALLSHLESFIMPLVSAGAVMEYDESSVTAFGGISEPVNIVTAPYPEYPTDLHPQAVPLLASCFGGRITEGVWNNRFAYLSELAAFGIGYELCDGSVNIMKSCIRPATAVATDLRGGAALMLAALRADGKSIIDRADIIKRGYGNIVEKLTSIGADIKEIQ